jgi:hypothetical protein
MNRFAWTGVLLAGAVGGCLPNQFAEPRFKNVGDKPADARPAVAPPVAAKEITPANAQEKEQLLREEIDRDMRQAQESAENKK